MVVDRFERCFEVIFHFETTNLQTAMMSFIFRVYEGGKVYRVLTMDRCLNVYVLQNIEMYIWSDQECCVENVIDFQQALSSSPTIPACRVACLLRNS